MAATPSPTVAFSPFVLVSERLVFVPSPMAINVRAYRDLFARIHADSAFCEMGFGQDFPVRSRNDQEAREFMLGDVNKRWGMKGMGDFAVGWLTSKKTGQPVLDATLGRPLQGLSEAKGIRIIEASTLGDDLSWADEVEWVGYSCARDGTTCIPEPKAEDLPLPPWLEMLEIRYGVIPEYWGKGLAVESSEVVIEWAIREMGARRFIGETQKHNSRSAKVLEKLGFKQTDTNYFQEPDQMQEWALVVS